MNFFFNDMINICILSLIFYKEISSLLFCGNKHKLSCEYLKFENDKNEIK
jgi:hypothetical protein